LTVVGPSSRALATIPVAALPERRRTLSGALAAFAARRLVGFAQWQARRAAEAAARAAARPSEQQFRGFLQINLIRLER
jgi:hypothetical protein